MMYRSDKSDKGTIVYVGGLEGDVKKEAIEAEFEKFGKLNRVWVAFNPPGFAFVEFDNKEDAETAVNAMHDKTLFGSKLRVEISRGRGRGSRGGGRGRGFERGGGRDFRGGRGDFRGGRGDFRGGRGDFGRGRGMGRGRGGFGGGRPFDQDDIPFRGNRFDGYEDRRRPEFVDRDFGPRRDVSEFDAPRPYGPGRDYPPRDIGARDYPPRNIGGRDFAPRDGGRDYPPRDIPERDFPGREYGAERELNGVRSYGGPSDVPPIDRGYGGGRDLSLGHAALTGRDYGTPRDIPPVRDIDGGRDYPARDYGGVRDVGMRRDAPLRDFEPPRDLGNPREYGGRPSRPDFPENRFGPSSRGGFGNGDVRRPGDFDRGRFAGGAGESGDYDGYGARDRFRSRSPIGRVSRPPLY